MATFLMKTTLKLFYDVLEKLLMLRLIKPIMAERIVFVLVLKIVNVFFLSLSRILSFHLLCALCMYTTVYGLVHA